jgi:hypothetical protein
LTTKDRIRLLERNPLEKDVMAIAEKSAIQAASFLQTRLKEAQALVRGFWDRGDARRGTLKMDRWWWAWNICFAITPAAMIAVYMELWGVPLVEARSKELDLYRRTKVGLLESLDDDDTVEDDDDDDAGGDENETQAGTLPLTLLGSTTQPSSVSSSQHASTRDSTNPLPPESSQEGPSLIKSTDPAIAELHSRILLLENKLDRQKRQMDKQRRLQHQRVNQSGIKNRSDEKFLLKEVEKRKIEKSADVISSEAEPFSKPTLFTMAQAYIQQNTQGKLDAMHDFGQQLLSSWSRPENNATKDDVEATHGILEPAITGTAPGQTVSVPAETNHKE